MGKLEGSSLMNHFSHEHPLKFQSYIARKTTCSACKESLSESFYACFSCNFFLHKTCFNLRQTLKHHSDQRHNLVLLPSPAYPEGFFKCNACGAHGDGFSYHCRDCQIDLHTTCASMPPSVKHAGHAHTLGICFTPPYESQGFSCDVCKRPGSNHWLYRCGLCDFDAHMKCATTTTTTTTTTTSTSRGALLPKSPSLPTYRTNHLPRSPQPRQPLPPPPSPTPAAPLVQIYYSSPPPAEYSPAITSSSQVVLNKSASLPNYQTHNHFSPPPAAATTVQQPPCNCHGTHQPQYHHQANHNHYQGTAAMGVPVQSYSKNTFMQNMAGHAVEGLVGSVVEAVIEGIVS